MTIDYKPHWDLLLQTMEDNITTSPKVTFFAGFVDGAYAADREDKQLTIPRDRMLEVLNTAHQTYSLTVMSNDISKLPPERSYSVGFYKGAEARDTAATKLLVAFVLSRRPGVPQKITAVNTSDSQGEG